MFPSPVEVEQILKQIFCPKRPEWFVPNPKFLPISTDIQEYAVDMTPEARIIELEAAIRTVLATWDDGTEKLVAFMKDQNPQTAEAYSAVFPRMFDAAILMRTVLHHK